MKLRCVTNSIRLRLRKSDILTLKTDSRIIDSLNFPTQTSLKYGVYLTPEDHKIDFDGNKMIIHINEASANKWMDSQDVGLAFKLPINEDQSLSILIEKDFPCKHTGADFDDTYHELQPEEFKMYRKSG